MRLNRRPVFHVQRELRWTARVVRVCMLFVAIALVAVACRDVKPTESVLGIGPKPAHVCFTNGLGLSCTCDAIPPHGSWTGLWPNCVPTDVPPPVTGDSAKVWCTPHSPLFRGDSVTCRIYVGRFRRFQIRNEQGISADPSLSLQNLHQDDSTYAAGDTAIGAGRIAASTIATVKVRMADSSGIMFDLPPVTDRLDVLPRPFPKYAINSRPLFLKGVERHTMTDYPVHYARDTSGNRIVAITIGTFRWHELGMFAAFDAANTAGYTILTGPDAGLSYLLWPPFLNGLTQSWLHPGLYGGLGNYGARTWYRDRTGRRGSGARPRTARVFS